MPPETPPPNGSALPELIGLILLVVGVCAVVTAAFLVDVRLGLATVGAAAATVGFWLTFREA